MARLTEATKARGFAPITVKLDAADLVALNLPAIARTRDDQLILVEPVGRLVWWVSSPGSEAVSVSETDFAAAYSGIAMILPREGYAPTLPDRGGPDIRFDSLLFDFGRVKAGQKAETIFEFVNQGRDDLVISGVEASCGCTSITLSSDRIAPRGAGAVFVTLDTSDRLGSQTYEVQLRTNDPVTPSVRLSIRAAIYPEQMLVSPREVDFGLVRRGQDRTRTVYLLDPSCSDLAVTDLSSDSSSLRLKVDRIETGESFPRYAITVELQPTAQIGELRAVARIQTNHPKEPIVDIAVRATVTGSVGLQPEVLFLGLVTEGETKEGRVLLSSVSNRPLGIERVGNTLPDLVVEMTETELGRQWVVIGHLLETAPVGPVEGTITITINDPDQPQLIVPVRGFVQARPN